MRRVRRRRAIRVMLVVVVAASEAGGVTLEELAARMERLERKVAAYEARYGPLDEGATAGKARSVGRSAKAAMPGETLPAGGDAASIDAAYGVGGAAGGGGSGWWERTTLGGYGEMHLQLGDREEIDFHRWVLFLNHKFNERVRLRSELELEHSIAGEGKGGEIELEQAFVEFDLGRGLWAKAGLFLLPVGMLNEVHEPNTFFGTERNPVESEIIPTTWWEGGVGLNQVLENGLHWDLALHSALDVPTSGDNAYRIRSGRRKVSKAPASDAAVTGRLRYTGVPGLDLSVFGQYQNDVTQTAGSETNRALFGGAAADFRRGGFGLRGLVGYWDIGGREPAALGADQQYGCFLEPSYTWLIGEEARVGLFARYNFYRYSMDDVDQFDVGANFWPIDNVVFKADYSHIDPEGEAAENVFNLGVGYSF